MDKELTKRLNSLKIEDFCWIILMILILLSFYSNNIERDYLISKNTIKKEQYRLLTIFIFIIAELIYLYYAYDSYNTLKKIKPNDKKQTKENAKLNYISSILIVIAGIIIIYIAITDTELDIELALN